MSLPTFENAVRTDILKDFCSGPRIKQLICDNVGADCHAVTYDDEIIYTYYDNDEKTPMKSLIQQEMFRDYIIKNTHSAFLVNIYTRAKNAKITLYMFSKPNAYCIVMEYNADQKTWNVYQLENK